MSRTVKAGVVVVSVFVLGYVTLGYVLGQTSQDRAYRALSVYSEVLQRIQQDYVEEPNLPLVTAGALHGLLESLDPRSGYLSPREYADYKKRSEKEPQGQVGAALSKRFGYVAVVAVLPDSPAHKAGLRAGDLFESISGFATREMSIEQAQTLLAGEPGTGIKVSVISRRFGSGQAEEMDIVRRAIPAPPLAADRLENEVAYLRIPMLNTGRAAEIRQKLLEFEKQGLRKLVLDLRDCALGETSEGIETARLFVPAGTLATLRGQTVSEKKFEAEPAKVTWKHPVTVLISNGTSGAAELVAAALSGNAGASGGKVELVGERTFGSASQQKIIPLDDGAALILTVANYFTPAGKSIPEEGVEPTVEVSSAPDSEDPAASESSDPPLKRAIEILLNPASAEKKGQARVRPIRNFDRAA